MHLTHLSLTNFRSFARLDMDVPRRVLLLVGDNAQGKTTLLEAIYYLAAFTSLHASTDRQLINFLAGQESLAVGRVVGEFERGGQRHRIEARLIQEATAANGPRLRKEVLVDGVKRSVHEALRLFNAVIFLPQMTSIVEGGPEERRRYLNLALSQTVPGYAQALTEYSQILSQRNALLKQLAERRGDISQLDYWDELLSKRGAVLISNRIEAVQELEREATRYHYRLTHGQEVLRMVYHPAYDPLPKPAGQFSLPLDTDVDRSKFTREQIQQGFQRRLELLRPEEIARGVTTIGPHRDEVRFLANGVDLGDFGSRGQVRTTLLALKLAELHWMKTRTGEWPVLLLDETLAELDAQRRKDLLEILTQSEQSVLTTTDLTQFPEAFVRESTVWQVQTGVVARA
ncbi:MAG TPA: DNA replication/repair protein RecF [Chloroflexi bacterium]|nr:DNA replication/repair protein RecF [Chloroflexota bacterium]